MLKLGIAVLFALVAALVILLAGLVSHARILTMLLRALCGFAVTTVVVWLIAFILEEKHIIGLDKNMVEIIAEEEQEKAEAEAAAQAEQSQDAGAGEPEEAAAAPDEAAAGQEPTTGAAGFSPLQTDNLSHIETPPAG